MKTLGIIGGMGPLATVDFFAKIVNRTAAQKDNEHIHIIIDNYPQIPDRSNFILNGGPNPIKELIETAIRLQLMGAEVLVMPCNTAHYFIDEIKKFIQIPIINMIEETALNIKSLNNPAHKVALLATQGTYTSNLYKRYFEQYGIEITYPSDNIKNLLMEIIYNVKSGHLNQKDQLQEVLKHFTMNGVNRYILGCTELPIAVTRSNIKGQFIDPTVVLADAAIRYVGASVKDLVKRQT